MTTALQVIDEYLQEVTLEETFGWTHEHAQQVGISTLREVRRRVVAAETEPLAEALPGQLMFP